MKELIIDAKSVEVVLRCLKENLRYSNLRSVMVIGNTLVEVEGVKNAGFEKVEKLTFEKYKFDPEKQIKLQLGTGGDPVGKADLVICLESLQDVPFSLVNSALDLLISKSDIILFSVAIPGQIGRQGLNLQWPEYWAELLNKRGMVVLDCLRYELIHEQEVMWQLRQNVFLVMRRSLWVQKYFHLKQINPDFRLIHTEVMKKLK